MSAVCQDVLDETRRVQVVAEILIPIPRLGDRQANVVKATFNDGMAACMRERLKWESGRWCELQSYSI